MHREYFGYWKRTSSETSKTSGTLHCIPLGIRPELGVREYSSGFSLTGLDVTNLALPLRLAGAFHYGGPSTTAVLVVVADCSLERS